MRILFIVPYPPSRIRIRSYGFLSQLKHKHDVTLLVQVASAQEMADIGVLQKQGFEVVAVRESRQRSMLHSGIALFGSSPLQVAYARSTRFLQAAYHLCAQRTFDVIHVEHLRGIASVSDLAQSFPLVWDAVDCISALFQQTATSGHSLPLRVTAALEYKRTQRYEAKMLQQLPHIITISEHDRRTMLALQHNSSMSDSYNETNTNIDVVSSGVDLEYFHPMQQEKHPYNIVFSGKMSYHANIAAALYLYNEIMPLIWKQNSQVTLTLVGSKPPTSLQRLAIDPRVKVTGYVDDIRPYVRQAQVMVSPTVYSVGLQNKVLEAMALGTATVVATQSTKALSAVDGRDLLAAASAQEFADAVLNLLNNSDMRENISRNGRSYVEQYHNWQTMTERLVNVYEQAIETHRNSSSLPSNPSEEIAMSTPPTKIFS